MSYYTNDARNNDDRDDDDDDKPLSINACEWIALSKVLSAARKNEAHIFMKWNSHTHAETYSTYNLSFFEVLFLPHTQQLPSIEFLLIYHIYSADRYEWRVQIVSASERMKIVNAALCALAAMA